MNQNLTTDPVIEEIHAIRREISDRFHGDIDAVAEDAAKRLAASGRRIWQPPATNQTLRRNSARKAL